MSYIKKETLINNFLVPFKCALSLSDLGFLGNKSGTFIEVRRLSIVVICDQVKIKNIY